MTRDEVLKLPGRDNPVLCADGKMAMLIIYPRDDETPCGVQVHGEADIRWIDCADLEASPRGALKQTGAPATPNLPVTELFQKMLALEWAGMGGLGIQLDADEPPFRIARAETKIFVDGIQLQAFGFSLKSEPQYIDMSLYAKVNVSKFDVINGPRYFMLDAPDRPTQGVHDFRIEFPNGRVETFKGAAAMIDGELSYLMED